MVSSSMFLAMKSSEAACHEGIVLHGVLHGSCSKNTRQMANGQGLMANG
jgi:hypothetical protein